jgi:hypothetical protein
LGLDSLVRRKSFISGGSAGALVCVIAWVFPGAGHLWLGRVQKGTVFFIVLPLMYLIGLWLEGQVFSFDLSQPLVALAALADFGIGLPYLLTRFFGAGEGRVVAVTYEYGNTFLVVAGLLNSLVVLDAYDIALGRK